MRNIIGQPVSGEDFFPRPDIVKSIKKALNAKLHVFFSGPVKSGKTSILFHLRDNTPKFNWVFIDVGAVIDEAQFYKTIYEELVRSPFFKEQHIPAQMEESDSPFEKLVDLCGLYKSDQALVIVLDNFSRLLQTLFEADAAAENISLFLNNQRAYRNQLNRLGSNVLFIYTSTHNMEYLAKKLNIPQAFTDLYQNTLTPLTSIDASHFVERLLKNTGLISKNYINEDIVFSLSWLSPFHLQLFVHELATNLKGEDDPVMKIDIHIAIKSVLKHREYFDEWRGSLRFFLSDLEDQVLTVLLDLIAQKSVMSESELLGGSGIDWNSSGIHPHELLKPLVQYGCLSVDHNRAYSFISPIFKEWWLVHMLNNPANLPMYAFSNGKTPEFKSVRLERLFIRNIKCFEKVEIKFDSSLNTSLIIGTNGKGKSTILQLIALGLSGISIIPFPYTWKNVIKQGKKTGYFEIDLLVEDQPVHLEFEIDKNDSIICLKGKEQLEQVKKQFLLLAYGVNRSIKLEETRPNKQIESIATLFGENGYLKHIKISSTFNYLSKHFDTLKTLINRVLLCEGEDEPVEMVHFDPEGFYFKTATSPDTPLPIEALSDGFKSTFVWLFDVIIRILERGGNLQNIGNITGIILLDEVDLHLHPTWQRTILKSIETLLPNIQFIVTSHSPFVVQSARNESLVVLEKQRGSDNVLVVDKNITSELSYNAIVREVFNIRFPFSAEVESQMVRFREMQEAIRDNKPVDEELFKALVLDIADRGVELDSIMRRELQSMEKRSGRSYDLWRK